MLALRKLEPRMRHRGEIEIPNQKYTGEGPHIAFWALFTRAFEAQGGRHTSRPFDAPLSRHPHQAHSLFNLPSIIHKETLRAKVSMGQILSV
eukprot:Skav206682  [mRNA]  locus=scaffold1895:236547:238010:- [translate_table: standard]